jgi:hypothetical protein
MSLNGEGELDWHGAFGPVQGAATSPLSLTFFPPPIDLAADARDDLYVLVTVGEAPRVHNVQLAGCDELSTDPAPGTWIVKLGRDGFAERARCSWARRLD